jgi:hypothetical protein
MRKIQKTAIVGGAVATLMAGGVAFAAWTSTGSGHGDVTAGDASTIPVSAVSSDLLYPTGSVDLTVTVGNGDPYPLNLDSLTATSVTVDGTHGDAGCDVAKVHATSGTYQTALANRIAVDQSIDKTLKLSMDADAANACKGAIFTVHYDASAHSVN